MNYEEWHKEYMEKKIINLKNELNEKDIEVLSKLDIEVQDKIYTQYDFEIFMINVGAYDRDDTMSELDLEYTKDFYCSRWRKFLERKIWRRNGQNHS